MPSAIAAVNRNRTQLSEILAEVSMETGVSLDDLRSPSKRALFVKARSFFALRAREQGYALIDIGEALNRCHTTILEQLKKITPDREGSCTQGAPGVPFPVQKGAQENMTKADLKKAVDRLTKDEKKDLVKEIAEGGTKEDRDNLAALFSGAERERLADAPQDAARGEARVEVPAAPAKKKSFLDDL